MLVLGKVFGQSPGDFEAYLRYILSFELSFEGESVVSCPIGSMGLVYLPTFTIKINHV